MAGEVGVAKRSSDDITSPLESVYDLNPSSGLQSYAFASIVKMDLRSSNDCQYYSLQLLNLV